MTRVLLPNIHLAGLLRLPTPRLTTLGSRLGSKKLRKTGGGWEGSREARREGKVRARKAKEQKTWKWGSIYRQKIAPVQGRLEGAVALASAKPNNGKSTGHARK